MPKSSTPKENSVVAAIGRYLDKLGPICCWEKTHGGGYGRAGKPDITGCLAGQRFELEVKRPGGKPTKLQLAKLKKWHEAGAIADVVESVDEVRAALLDFAAENGITLPPVHKSNEPKPHH